MKMWMNKFLFKEKTLYSYKEILQTIQGETGGANLPFNNDLSVIEFLSVVGLISYDSVSGYMNDFGLTFLTYNDDESSWECSDNVYTILNKITSRYEEHWAIMCDSDTREELIAKSKSFMKKVFNLLDYSFPKYSKLLSLYQETEDKLLDKLGRTRSGSREMSSSGENASNSLNLFNDTPQTTDVVADIDDNQYVSELNKGSTSGTTSSSGSDGYEEDEAFDTKTNMEKLEEIKKKYAQLWREWLNEFDMLFIEEVNF